MLHHVREDYGRVYAAAEYKADKKGLNDLPLNPSADEFFAGISLRSGNVEAPWFAFQDGRNISRLCGRYMPCRRLR